MIRIFVGFDQREAVNYHAFCQSVIDTCSRPVSFTPLGNILKRSDGSNAFNVSRFLVPELCDFEGYAIYADSDMIVKSDLAELWALRPVRDAIKVVKHDYKTKHPRKNLGTRMESINEDYPGKNQSSLMLWNCDHVDNRRLTRDFVAKAKSQDLHRFRWTDAVGEIPREWNWLVNEFEDNPEAKLLHYTIGSPCFEYYSQGPHSLEWHQTYQRLTEPKR